MRQPEIDHKDDVKKPRNSGHSRFGKFQAGFGHPEFNSQLPALDTQ
jgi:hypothetical protein